LVITYKGGLKFYDSSHYLNKSTLSITQKKHPMNLLFDDEDKKEMKRGWRRQSDRRSRVV